MYTTLYHPYPIDAHSFLVTGGAGFIGSNIVEYLLKYKAKKVRVLDNLSIGFYHNIKEFDSNPAFEFYEGDIRDVDTCIKACEGIDFVSHQAALGSVPRSINDPLTTNDVNIKGHLNMLWAVKETGVRRMVYAASSSTYGDSKELPRIEEKIGKPLSPYAVTKYVNELYADVFSKIYNVHTIGLRYFNVFGPKQNIKGAYAAVIPQFINAILKNEKPTIFGDGEQTRDFTFVENAVQANILAMLTENSEAVNKIYNVACGENTSLNQLFALLKTISNSKIEPIYGDERPGDVHDSLANISKAINLLNYNPLYNFDTGVKITFDWFQKTYNA